MRRQLALVIAIALPAIATVLGSPADAESWIFKPSTYSHDPVTGGRVVQFARKNPAYFREDPTYSQSGYRHIRTSIRGADGSADRLHVVQTWGAGAAIRPYGEWQRPFRAGATPYGPWGNPQGPWTTPFDSWNNPYGLGQLPYPPWGLGPVYPQYGGGAGYQPYRQNGRGATNLPAHPSHGSKGHPSGGHKSGRHSSGHPSATPPHGSPGHTGHP